MHHHSKEEILLIFESSFLDNEIKRKQSSASHYSRENKTCAQIHQDTVTKSNVKVFKRESNQTS